MRGKREKITCIYNGISDKKIQKRKKKQSNLRILNTFCVSFSPTTLHFSGEYVTIRRLKTANE